MAHPSFINLTTVISSAAITTVSVHKDYVRVIPLSNDAAPLNYNTIFTDRTGNISLDSTFINTQETLNGTTRNHKDNFTTNRCHNKTLTQFFF